MHAHCPTGYVQPRGARPPCAAWLQDRSRAHSTESSRQADRRGGHLLCPPPQTKAGSFGQASTWPQVLGVQRTERCQHSGSQQCRVSLRYVFSAPRDPWGSWLERTLGMPEAWPGRVRALSTQPLPRKWGLWASGGGGGGGEGRSALGASLGSSTQGGGSECRGPAAVLFMVLGAARSPAQEGPGLWRAAGPLSGQRDEKPGEREGQPEAEPGMGGQTRPEGLARLGEWTRPGAKGWAGGKDRGVTSGVQHRAEAAGPGGGPVNIPTFPLPAGGHPCPLPLGRRPAGRFRKNR